MKRAVQHTIIVAVGMAALVFFAIQLIILASAMNNIIIDCIPGYHPDYTTKTCVPDDPMGTPIFVTLGIGQSNPTGTFKLTGVSATSVSGLQFYEYPVPGPGVSVSLVIGQQVTNGCTVTLRLESINFAAQQATFMQTIDTDPNKQCPICWWQLEAMDETTATRE